MKTVIIQIGNTDDKLPQERWASFVESMRTKIQTFCNDIHFFGGSPNWERWQNVAWVITCEDSNLAILKLAVSDVRYRFQQDSAAWTEGKTEFI